MGKVSIWFREIVCKVGIWSWGSVFVGFERRFFGEGIYWGWLGKNIIFLEFWFLVGGGCRVVVVISF